MLDSSDSSQIKFWKSLRIISVLSHFLFGVLFLQHTYIDRKYPKDLFLSHGWISLVKRSNMGISGASEVPRLISIGMLSAGENYVVWTNDLFKSSANPWTQTGFMPVRRGLVNVVLLSENYQLFAEINKNAFLVIRAHFLIFRKKKRSRIFDEKSKTDLGFEIGQPSWKCQQRVTL